MIKNGTTYHDDTSPEVVYALERIRASGGRVRIFYGDRKTGKTWEEENYVIGTIGRSTGPVKVPILLHNSRFTGGGVILDDCIVALKTKWQWWYRHPKFTTGSYTIHPSEVPGHEHEVHSDGKLVARFHTEVAAGRYIDFMIGRRMAK